MSHEVFCRKYKAVLPGLPNAPFPGSEGEEIYQQVSEKAWQEWLAYQTRLINEKQLQLFDPTAQSYLSEQRNRFLDNLAVDEVEGYVPTEEGR